MAAKLGDLYHALVFFGIPGKECETFIEDLLKSSYFARSRRIAFLTKHKEKIEAGSAALAGRAAVS